jgi:hypothetical protein
MESHPKLAKFVFNQQQKGLVWVFFFAICVKNTKEEGQLNHEESSKSRTAIQIGSNRSNTYPGALGGVREGSRDDQEFWRWQLFPEGRR